MAVLGLHCCAQVPSACGRRGYFLAVVHGFSLRWLPPWPLSKAQALDGQASVVEAPGLWSSGSVVEAHGL